MKRVVIDIGCGPNKRPGALGIDIAVLPVVDIVADITAGLPFRDSTVDQVVASHVLEHFDNLVAVMNEIWRVCKPGARVSVTVPHASSSFMTWRDPTHRRGLNLSTFSYFDDSTFEGQKFRYYRRASFQTVYGRLRFVAGGPAARNAPGRRPSARVVTGLLEALANRSSYSQHLCERWWGPLFGIAEACVLLKAVK